MDAVRQDRREKPRLMGKLIIVTESRRKSHPKSHSFLRQYRDKPNFVTNVSFGEFASLPHNPRIGESTYIAHVDFENRQPMLTATTIQFFVLSSIHYKFINLYNYFVKKEKATVV